MYQRPAEPPRFAHAAGRAAVRPPSRAADTGELPAAAPQPRVLPVALPLRIEIGVWFAAVLLLALTLSTAWMAGRLLLLQRAVEAPIVLTTVQPTP